MKVLRTDGVAPAEVPSDPAIRKSRRVSLDVKILRMRLTVASAPSFPPLLKHHLLLFLAWRVRDTETIILLIMMTWWWWCYPQRWWSRPGGRWPQRWWRCSLGARGQEARKHPPMSDNVLGRTWHMKVGMFTFTIFLFYFYHTWTSNLWLKTSSAELGLILKLV